jgi:hypothetical protein
LRRLAAALLPQALGFLTFLRFVAFVCFIGFFVSSLLRYFATSLLRFTALHLASSRTARHCQALGCDSTKPCHAASLPCGVFRHSPRRQVP